MRIAVFADIHGNFLALEAVLTDLARRGGADLTVNLGDLVSGPLWPRETIERLMDLDWPTVRGNHDRRAATDPLAEMGPSDRFARDRLTAAQRDWLEALPVTLELAPGILAFHARPDHDERYLTEVIADGRLARAPLSLIEKRLAGIDRSHRLLLSGHSHRPDLVRLPDGRMLFNPGSVGDPAYRDDTAPARARAPSSTSSSARSPTTTRRPPSAPMSPAVPNGRTRCAPASCRLRAAPAPCSTRSPVAAQPEVLRATAARMSAFNASSSISSPSRKSMARLVLPSRLELNRPEGSLSEAPLAKVVFTAFL